MKKITKNEQEKLFCLFLLIVVLVNILSPLFSQETGRNICGKSEKDRIYIRDSRRRKDLLH